MQGLMLKLVNVDAAGERALRVVSYFDQLSTNTPDLDAVVRATAVLADCTAGVEIPGRGLGIRYSQDGDLPQGSLGHRIGSRGLDGAESGTVWLEREDGMLELDEFIIERFALTISTVLQRRTADQLEEVTGFSDPALAQVLVNERASEAERSRAAQLLGLQPSGGIQLLALDPDDGTPIDTLVRDLRQLWGRQVFAAQMSKRLALILVVGGSAARLELADFPGRVGAGPVVEMLEAPRSWATARETLRFAGAGSAWPRALDSNSVGVLRLLGRIDPGTIAAEPDVLSISRIADQEGGAQSLVLLDNFLHASSLREAARATNFHHSSLQSRVLRIGGQLGIDLESPAGRERAALALLLWRCIQ